MAALLQRRRQQYVSNGGSVIQMAVTIYWIYQKWQRCYKDDSSDVFDTSAVVAVFHW